MLLQEESRRLLSAIQMESASTGSLQLELGVLKEELAKLNRGAEVLKVSLYAPMDCMLQLHNVGLSPFQDQYLALKG